MSRTAAPKPPQRQGAARLLRRLAAGAAIALCAAFAPRSPAAPVESSAAAEPSAADEYVLRRWIVEDGLPHNVLTKVVQDKRGYLWIGSGAGLVRFTGTKFTEYPIPASLRTSETLGTNIRDLALESDGSLALLPAGGGILRLRDGVMSLHPANDALKGCSLVELYAEADGTLWIGATRDKDRVFARWANGAVEVFDNASGPAQTQHRVSFACDALGRTWIACDTFIGWYDNGRLVRAPDLNGTDFTVAPARSGGVWVATGDRLVRVDGTQITEVGSGPTWANVTGGVRTLFEDRGGTLWIATRRLGLFVRSAGGPVQAFRLNDVITSLTEDTEGNLWASTEGAGIFRLRRKVFSLLDHTMGMPDDINLAVCDDADGTLWCADRSGGVMRYAGGTLKAIHLADGRTPYVTSVCPDTDGNIWVGASEGLFKVGRDDPSVLKPVDVSVQEVRALKWTRRNELWIGTADNRLRVLREGHMTELTEEAQFTGRRPIAIAEDLGGSVWVATLDQLLLEFSEGRCVRRFTPQDIPGEGHVQSLHVDSYGALWIGTTEGLILFKNGHFHLLTEKDGLPDRMIYQLLEDGQGRLWIGSRRGLCMIPLKDLHAVAEGSGRRIEATTLGKDEGVPPASASDGTQPSAWRGRDGRLWFTTHAGLLGIDPESILPDRPAPMLYIDRGEIDGKPVPVSRQIAIPPGRHQLDLWIDALGFSAPDKVQVWHQLQGFDLDWVPTDTNRPVTYVHVPPGVYTFRVRAGNSDGHRREQTTSLSVVVVPSWWQTWWALAVAIALFAAVIAWLARLWSHRKLRQRLRALEHRHALEQERARIARDLHDELGGSVTQLGMLAERLRQQTGPGDLQAGLGQMAWRARRLAGDVESIVWAVSPRNTAWPGLANFIAHFARRFFRDSGIECQIDGLDTIPDRPVSPEAQHNVLAVAKESMNNIAKHARARRVTLTMDGTGEVFVLCIRDDGIGFDPNAPEHAERNGLSNMRGRLRELGGTCDITSSPGAGAEIRLAVPFSAAPSSLSRK